MSLVALFRIHPIFDFTVISPAVGKLIHMVYRNRIFIVKQYIYLYSNSARCTHFVVHAVPIFGSKAVHTTNSQSHATCPQKTPENK
jgi:hypothetical protein